MIPSALRLQELLFCGKRLLENSPSAALDTALFLEEASGLSREQLYTHIDYELNEEQCIQYLEFLKRRQKGECTAHILGRKEFWGLKFFVSPAVLVPRPDTETLVEAAIGILRSAPRSPLPILDLCTGSGAVAIALKHEFPGLEVQAADISEQALEIARKNAEHLGCKVDFFQGDLFDALKMENDAEAVSIQNKQCFCLITANAPYIPAAEMAKLPAEVQNEPQIALDGGSDGLEIIRRIIAGAPAYLEKGGSLVLEADPSQMKTITALMQDQGFARPKLHKDLAGRNRTAAAAFLRRR